MPIHEYAFSVGETSGSLSYEAPDPSTAIHDYSDDLGYYVHVGVSMVDFDFTFDGVQWDPADILWGYVALDSDGLLAPTYGNSIFGTCYVGGCAAPGVNIDHQWFNFSIAAGSPQYARWGGPGYREINYDTSLAYVGSYEAPIQQVPELSPGNALIPALLLMGVVALFRERRAIGREPAKSG